MASFCHRWTDKVHQRLRVLSVVGLDRDCAGYNRIHIPVSPEDSRTEIPLSPNWPIMLQTRMAYFSGTVCKLCWSTKN